MKNLKLIGLVALFGLMILGMTGCSETGTTTPSDIAAGSDDYDGMDMNKANGGLTATDETEAFGDAYFLDTEAEYEDDAADDPLENDAEVAGYEAQVAEGDPTDPNRPTITVLKLLWGQLDGLAEDIDEGFDVLDWTGRLSVDRGIAVVRRVILFERPYDHLVRPINEQTGTINRRAVGWVSHTGPHYDGLVIEIIEPPMQPDVAADEPAVNMLHLVTPQISLDIPVADLSGYDEVYPVDEAGNALSIEGHLLSDLLQCPKGFLGGIWVARPLFDEEGNQVADGFFKGRWVDVWGRMMGFLRGGYGVNDAGERVFFGKYISRHGQFRGLLSGTYGPNEETGLGAFQGEWVNAAGTREGVLGGQYMQIPDRPGGFFSGRWATLCDTEAVDSIQ